MVSLPPEIDLHERCTRDPHLAALRRCEEDAWFNPDLPPAVAALPETGFAPADIDAAAARLERFAPYLAQVFPETRATAGIIESPLAAAPALQAALARRCGRDLPGRLWLKRDDVLPVAGSIKARGGIHEVLKHAEDVALHAGLVTLASDYRDFATPRVRSLLSRHQIAVGSTGNLGLSIGITGVRLGFRVSVHMSADARQWKKDLLRAHGVTVVEHAGDYSAAVAHGRAQAAGRPDVHFIDDENSIDLFLGYAVAARRLAAQLRALEVPVDARHPLFVYLPCGVGGAPGGITLGLKTMFGDAVHCVFAEPTHAPCMYLGVYTGLHDRINVQDIGIDGVTAADGLAVGRPSAFIGRRLAHLIDGFCTVSDDELFCLVAVLAHTENVRVEPSAAAGLCAPWRVLADDVYRERLGFDRATLDGATHVAWLTGGALVPASEMQAYVARGNGLLRSAGAAGVDPVR